jgi:16S rRNA (uracil1498-N3)-methyltransferase
LGHSITSARAPGNRKLPEFRRLLIIMPVIRRLHVPVLSVGRNTLDERQARHAVDVLRLASGTNVEVFDDAGHVGTGELVIEDEGDVWVKVQALDDLAAAARRPQISLTIASAVPKGERADWMIEKLSELGVAEFVPLAATRSVVLPEGKNKRERWMRIPSESAKQSRRTGVMRVGELTPVGAVIERVQSCADTSVGWHFSTANDAQPACQLAQKLRSGQSVVALIGPEGGWTDAETAQFVAAGLIAARLTPTVLRVETAAIAAAVVIGSIDLSAS